MSETRSSVLPGVPLPLSGNRQQDRQNQRLKQKLEEKILAACRSNPLTQSAYDMGWNLGLQRGLEFGMKDAYAAAILAMHDIAKYGRKRNKRLLRRIDWYIINRLTTEDLVEQALREAGVKIDFTDPFERVVDADA